MQQDDTYYDARASHFFDSAPTNKGCYKLWRMVLGIICPNPQKDDANYDAFCPASFDSTPTHKCAHKHKCKRAHAHDFV